VLRRRCTPLLDRIIRSGRRSPLNGDARFPERPTLTGYDAAKRGQKGKSAAPMDAVHARSGGAGVLAAFAAARKLP
jgi:hypothetical protein